MQEPENNPPSPMDDLDPAVEDKPPADKPPEGDPKPPSQEELDWASDLPSELKTHKSVLKFKKKEDMVNSYIELERKFSTPLADIEPSTEPNEAVKLFKTALNVDKKSYSEQFKDEKVAEIMEASGVHPKLGESMIKDLKEHFSEKSKNELKAKQEKWRAELLEGRDKAEVDKNLLAGLNDAGYTWEQWKDANGSNFMNPKLLSKLEQKGAKIRESQVIKIKEGKATGDLPADEEQLLAKYDDLASKADSMRNEGNFVGAEQLEEKLAEVQAKLIYLGKKENTKIL